MADGRGLSTTCDSALAAAVRAKVTAELAREQEWWRPALAEVHEIEDPDERSRARGELEEERANRRKNGVYLASRDALLRHHLQAVLVENGWNRDYPPVPPGVASTGGRRTGVPLASGRTGDRKGRLAVNLDTKLWEKVRRAAYHESKGPVAELRRWSKRYGDGPGRAEREGGALAGALAKVSLRRPTKEAMNRRRELRAKVITTGDILRMAAKRATS